MVDITSKNISGISDLVVWAEIKDDFIHSFENITYETRLKLTAEALHKLRVSSREHELIAPFPDTAERILSLLDFRIGFIDGNMFSLDEKGRGKGRKTTIRPRRYMYLVATFDNPWEPYMRLIYKPLGPFLDLLLCNCETYKLSQDVGFEEYAAWVRAHQLDSSIFYSTTGLTVRDQIYLSKLEKTQREHDAMQGDRLIAGLTHDFPEVLAEQVRLNPLTMPDTIRLGLEALTVLFRLADYYPADRIASGAGGVSGDGRLLVQVAQDLLTGWSQALAIAGAANPQLKAALEHEYAEPLAWFRKSLPAGPATNPDPAFVPGEVQGGILLPYDQPGAPITHGALLLMQISDPAQARRFIETLQIDWDNSGPPASAVFHNIAFTFEGLRRLGLAQDQLDAFPKEFREGSAERAPLIGDVRDNHPRRWRLPQHNWPFKQAPGDPPNPPVDLTEIDFVIQLRRPASASMLPEDFIDFVEPARAIFMQLATGTDEGALASGLIEKAGDQPLMDDGDDGTSQDPLAIEIARLATVAPRYGVTLLTVESMMRTEPPPVGQGTTPPPSDVAPTIDHFGFVDGISQPTLAPGAGVAPRDIVKRGDLLCGYANGQGDAAGTGPGERLQVNGTFLVIRKMSQDRQALQDFIAHATATNADLNEDEVAASIVGRRRDGTMNQLAAGNDFDFTGDPQGERCPLVSHIRRANPRDSFQQRPAPRILRRGMTYGKRYTGPGDTEARGVVFMAYNASIAEQYEVIQRWLNRGNSTGISGSQNDPLTGIGAEPGPRTMRFLAKGKVRRLTIDKPFVGLEWTMYLFVPSKTALRTLCAPRETIAPPMGSAPAGTILLSQIDALDDDAKRREWKRLLEDFLVKDPAERRDGPDVWAAIRAPAKQGGHDGVLVLPSGVATPFLSLSTAPAAPAPRGDRIPVVLVGSWDLIEEVLSDSATYSVRVQKRRVAKSFGAIFVAMDPHPPHGRYERESGATNKIIWDYSEGHEQDAFAAAYRCAEQVLDHKKLLAHALHNPHDPSPESFKLELRRELLMPALANLCSYWFDIPDVEAASPAGEYIERGGWGWDPVDQSGAATPAPGHRKPRCPGDFMAPSRYSFYPKPTDSIRDYGIAHGQALRAAAPHIVSKKRRDGNVKGIISKPMYAAIKQDDVLARNLIGIMEGMLPPTDGILRGIIYEWLDQDSLWRHQGTLHRASQGKKASLASATAALLRPIEEAMCKRPAPDLIYRTAVRDTVLGGQKIAAGSKVILGLVSAMQASLEDLPDVTAVFGGHRRKPTQDPGEPAHACPARKMVMASVMGVLSALLDSGRITAQPASLIVEISEYPLPTPAPQPADASPAGAA